MIYTSSVCITCCNSCLVNYYKEGKVHFSIKWVRQNDLLKEKSTFGSLIIHQNVHTQLKLYLHPYICIAWCVHIFMNYLTNLTKLLTFLIVLHQYDIGSVKLTCNFFFRSDRGFFKNWLHASTQSIWKYVVWIWIYHRWNF